MADIQTAWDAYLRGDAHEALKITTAMAKDDPDNAAAWYIMSQALDGERADIFYRKAMSLDPAVADHFSGAGDATLVDALPSPVYADDATPSPGLSYEGEEVPTTFLDETSDDFAEPSLADIVSEENTTEFYAVPDVRPKVAPLAADADEASPAVDRPQPRSVRASRGVDWNTLGLVIVGLLILVVLYLLINTLIGGA